ncbi:hypothetical protein EJ110_NYTH49397 [Nymphaea thermarum]|nr:hypothetical protein EJ110_NYTH49397 [Nymphaea thermarum]
MQDPNKPDSFKVFVRINGKKVLILLDNGATRNFLTEEAARRCNVPFETNHPQTIIVGGGGRLQCLSKGKDLEVVIKKKTFKVDFLVIPLDGVDLILGTSWEEFGSVAHRFPSTSAQGQVQGREGDSVTDLPVGPDAVQAKQPEPSRRKRKASELWARTHECAAEGLPEEVKRASKPVAEGGEGGAAKAEEVLGQDKPQGGQGPIAGLTELTRLEPSVSLIGSTPRAHQCQGLEEQLSQEDSALEQSPNCVSSPLASSTSTALLHPEYKSLKAGVYLGSRKGSKAKADLHHRRRSLLRPQVQLATRRKIGQFRPPLQLPATAIDPGEGGRFCPALPKILNLSNKGIVDFRWKEIGPSRRRAWSTPTLVAHPFRAQLNPKPALALVRIRSVGVASFSSADLGQPAAIVGALQARVAEPPRRSATASVPARSSFATLRQQHLVCGARLRHPPAESRLAAPHRRYPSARQLHASAVRRRHLPRSSSFRHVISLAVPSALGVRPSLHSARQRVATSSESSPSAAWRLSSAGLLVPAATDVAESNRRGRKRSAHHSVRAEPSSIDPGSGQGEGEGGVQQVGSAELEMLGVGTEGGAGGSATALSEGSDFLTSGSSPSVFKPTQAVFEPGLASDGPQPSPAATATIPASSPADIPAGLVHLRRASLELLGQDRRASLLPALDFGVPLHRPSPTTPGRRCHFSGDRCYFSGEEPAASPLHPASKGRASMIRANLQIGLERPRMWPRAAAEEGRGQPVTRSGLNPARLTQVRVKGMMREVSCSSVQQVFVSLELSQREVRVEVQQLKARLKNSKEVGQALACSNPPKLCDFRHPPATSATSPANFPAVIPAGPALIRQPLWKLPDELRRGLLNRRKSWALYPFPACLSGQLRSTPATAATFPATFSCEVQQGPPSIRCPKEEL